MEVQTEAPSEAGGGGVLTELQVNNTNTNATQSGDSNPTSDTQSECKELPVTVALLVRPLVGNELVDGCRSCVFPHVTEPSVSLVSEHKFTYDHVFHGPGPSEKSVFDTCVEPLVTGLTSGYNCTVLAYGQTGSGKTHCMGTACDDCGVYGDSEIVSPDSYIGVIPRVMRSLFENIGNLHSTQSVSLKVGFIEIHKEEIRDLLRVKNVVSLRDAPGGSGGVVMVGAREKPVSTYAEMAKALRDGSETRATAATGMNNHSSRSHAIFTIHVTVTTASDEGTPGGANVMHSKMHLVDLAGSERAKRTKAEGARLKEGIQINKGLLALGNVISALGDDKRRDQRGNVGHIPYRDSKLTRLLQDSLGGNSRTVMVACISPADANLDETLNTLKYANRARNIMNTPTVSFDGNSQNAAAQVAKLRRALTAARSEIAHLKLIGSSVSGSLGSGGAFSNLGGLGGDADTSQKLEAMEARAMIAEAEASRLRADLKSAEENVNAAAERELSASVQRDVLAMKLQDAGVSVDSDDGGTNVVRSYLSTIQALRNEQSRLKNQLKAIQDGRVDPYAEDPAASYDPEDELEETLDEPQELVDIDEEEPLEEDAEGDDLHLELASVERTLHAKEARMRAMASQAAEMQAEVDAAIAAGAGCTTAATPGGTPASHDVELVREKYGRLLKSLETEKLTIAAERDTLLAALSSAARNGADARKAAEVKTCGRLLELEQRLKDVTKLAAKHKDAARLREKSDLAAKALTVDIQRLRAARVELVRRMERATKKGIATQREFERALQQAKKEGRKYALAAQKAQSAVEHQAAVLRRKTEEASNAREQLRALQAAAKANRRRHVEKPGRGESSSTTAPIAVRAELTVASAAPVVTAAVTTDVALSSKAGPGTGLGLNARKQWIENEIVSSVERAELRLALEDALARRVALGRRYSTLSEKSPSKAHVSFFVAADACDSFVDDEIVSDEMSAVTTQIAALQERLYRSEEREETKGGMKRWTRVRSLGEARSLLTILFNAAAAARRKVGGVNDVISPVETTAKTKSAEVMTTSTSATVPASTDTPAPLAIAPNSAALVAPAAPLLRTPSVVAEADAVLRALKKHEPKREKRKKVTKPVRPAWQDVGPSTLLGTVEVGKEKRRAKSPTGEGGEFPARSETDSQSQSQSSPATSSSASNSQSDSQDSEVSSASLSETTPVKKSTSELISTWELISASRDARQRTEGLLDGSAARLKENARSPLVDIANADAPADEIRKRIDLSFGTRESVGADRVDCIPG